jgi:hypothetical protein
VPQVRTALALAGLAVDLLVLEELADVCKDGACDDGVHVDRERVTHELIHRLGGQPRDVHDAPLVLHERHRTVWNQQRERNLLQVLRGQQ